MSEPPTLDLAVIGGTGVYRLAPLASPGEQSLETPFGTPSSTVTVGVWNGRRVGFLARHGESHAILPHQVNYRANLWALSRFNPARVLAINAVGSLNQSLPPASLVVPDQIIDYTSGRAHTFVGEIEGIEPHVDFTYPFDPTTQAALAGAGQGLLAADAGVIGVTQGPRLESAAEIKRLARDGCDLVGMTSMPEAGLARELGLAYASVCIVANWAAGISEAPITLDEVLANVEAGSQRLMQVVERLLDGPVV